MFARDADTPVVVLDLDFGEAGFGQQFGECAHQRGVYVEPALATGGFVVVSHKAPKIFERFFVRAPMRASNRSGKGRVPSWLTPG
jgi:hypothetical protein